GVSLTEAASAADAGGSLALPPGDIRRTNSRNAPATRDLRHAVVNGTRGSVGGRRALRRATIRLRRAKRPPHGLVILPGGRTVRRSGARSREPRAGVPRGLSMPYTRRRVDASPGGTSARHPQGPASPHAKEARTHQRRCLEAQVARRTPRPVRPHPPECRECALHAPNVTRSVPSSAHPSDRPRRRREDGAGATRPARRRFHTGFSQVAAVGRLEPSRGHGRCIPSYPHDDLRNLPSETRSRKG